MGCFWKPSEELLKVPGVVDTVVGYTGKAEVSKPPTYESVCYSRDWVEGVRVRYDDDEITYDQLLDAYFEAQEPQLGSRQYASIIFPHDTEQEKAAQQWLERNAGRQRSDGFMAQWTQIEPLRFFYRAENYHQEYWQKTRPRIATMLFLLAASTSIFDNIIPQAYLSTFHSGCSAAVLFGLLYVVLERTLDAKVVKLE